MDCFDEQATGKIMLLETAYSICLDMQDSDLHVSDMHNFFLFTWYFFILYALVPGHLRVVQGGASNLCLSNIILWALMRTWLIRRRRRQKMNTSQLTYESATYSVATKTLYNLLLNDTFSLRFSFIFLVSNMLLIENLALFPETPLTQRLAYTKT